MTDYAILISLFTKVNDKFEIHNYGDEQLIENLTTHTDYWFYKQTLTRDEFDEDWTSRGYVVKG